MKFPVFNHSYTCRSNTFQLASLSGTLPPNFAITGYATEGALLISSRLSTDAANNLRKVWLLIMKTMEAINVGSKHGRKQEVRLPKVINEFRFKSNDFGLACSGVSDVRGNERKA